MSRGPGDRRPVIRLSLTEQLAFMRIIDHETHRTGRGLVNARAQPGGTHPRAERLLDQALRVMWRTPPG